jgi:hypothetical protein
MTEKKEISLPLETVWLKAAVVGGLWASVEIIVGSFLHNLRIPLSGSILAFFGVVLLIAFYKNWPDKGLIWRAGLICALMKSISPSAVILGPMIGILLEAMLLQLSITLFGGNMIGLIIGGSLSLFSALIHKLVSLLILYSFDIFKIYLNIFYFASKQLNLSNADPWVALSLLILVYLIIGFFAVILGNYIGLKSVMMKVSSENEFSFDPKAGNPLEIKSNRNYSLLYLFIHLISVPLILLMLNTIEVYYAIIFLAVYISFCIVHYYANLKRLRRPVFWMQLFFITMLATLFWNNFDFSGQSTHWQGLLVGVKMNLRALLVVIGFTAISVELRSPKIKTFLFRKGFQKIYLSLSLAFNALPLMMNSMAKPRTFITSPLKSISIAISQADAWLMTFQKNLDRME